ncbi:MAG: hypothetical protein QXI16_00150 [Sulfolobaceae archaeon]
MQIKNFVDVNEYGVWKITTCKGVIFGKCLSVNGDTITMEDFRHANRNVVINKKDIVMIEFSDKTNKKYENARDKDEK